MDRDTFETAMAGVAINWDLPDLVIPNAPQGGGDTQAEFRPPARYFAPSSVNTATNIGRSLLSSHARTLAQVERNTGVPARILLSIWGRESSYGRAKIPHDAFEILATKGFLSTRADYFTDELIAAFLLLDKGFATRRQMRSSWAGALGQPQFMPSNYLTYATDGDGDERADIWGSDADTLASIGAYLQSHGWRAGRDWGFEVTLPRAVSCALEGPDNARAISAWADMGINRVNGKPFPATELREDGFLLLPAGRFGPAFVVTSNFSVLKSYNESDAYALFVGHVGDRMQYGSGDFTKGWDQLDTMRRHDIAAAQRELIGLGYDVGGADGLIGNKTRRSIGAWQTQNGQPATCYPDNKTLRALLQ